MLLNVNLEGLFVVFRSLPEIDKQQFGQIKYDSARYEYEEMD